MRIFHLIYDHINNPWVGGGGSQRAYEIYRRLAGRHNITIICGKYPGAADYREGNMQFHFVGTDVDNYIFSTFSYAFAASRWLRQNWLYADMVVEDFAPYNPVFSFLVKKNAVIQLHQREGLHHIRKYWVFGIPFYLVERFYHKAYRNVVVVSEKSRSKFGLEDKAVIISNGIEADYLSAPESKGDYILFLGRLEIDSKGLDILINAVDFIENVDLRIAGKGKDEALVKQMVKGENGVKLIGFVKGKDKSECLQGCAFLVIPSRYEAQGIVVLEAAACGKPVIVSDIPELKYAVDAGFGISFKTGNAKDLAEKINFLLGDEPLRKEMGHKGREYAKNFTWDRIAIDYERFLLDIINKNKK